MQDELEKVEIRSPVSGTVTAVFAEEGALGFGLLFVIQDTENLIVKTNINEFDLAAVNLGDRVNIRADATGNTVFTGTLSRIAPTSTFTANGSIQNGATAEFECEVTVSSGNKGLKIGMNTRISIITEQKRNVYTVPFEAVTTNESGENIIYIAVLQEDESYLTEAVPVTTSMEIDRRIEVSADALADGVLVIRDAEGIQAGMLVTPRIHSNH